MHTRHKIYKLIDMYFMYVTVWALCHPNFLSSYFCFKHLNFKHMNKRITSSFAFIKHVISSIINQRMILSRQSPKPCISKPNTSVKLSYEIFCLAGSLPPVTTE